jgi:hypothetical protein
LFPNAPGSSASFGPTRISSNGSFSKEQVPRLLPTHAQIAPKWVSEVLSPRKADRDVRPKFAAHEEHGVD